MIINFIISNWLEIIGALFGLLYLYLEYNANKFLWPVGIIMPIIYVFIYFENKFYADMSINIYYFFASIYGFIKWSKRIENKPIDISKTPLKKIIPLSIIGIILFAIILYILANYTDSPVALGDSFTTALSIIAMWLLSNKYIEHWILWFIVNIISFALYFWKGLYPTAFLFFIYTIVPIFGYIKWRKLIVKKST